LGIVESSFGDGLHGVEQGFEELADQVQVVGELEDGAGHEVLAVPGAGIRSAGLELVAGQGAFREWHGDFLLLRN